MKKKMVIIILLISLLIDVQRASAAEVDYSHVYPSVGVVYCIDDKLDIVYYTDGANNWYFDGVEDWQIGDTILTIMHDNNTQNTVKDDVIVSIRYSNIKIEY